MRVQSSIPSYRLPPQMPAGVVKSTGYSTASVLVSPLAPSFPRISKFFNWLWSWIRPLFSCFLPKTVAETPPSRPIIQITLPRKKTPTPPVVDPLLEDPPALESATPAQLATGLGIIGTGIGGFCYWQWENICTVASGTLIKTLVVRSSTQYAEKIANKMLPSSKRASHILASASVWYGFNYLGYSLENIPLTFLDLSSLPLGLQFPLALAVTLAPSIGEPGKVFWAVTALNVLLFSLRKQEPKEQEILLPPTG